MAKILVIRLSAIGDVAMTIPVIHSLAVQYPQHHITVLSRKGMSAFFGYMPENVSFWGMDEKERHKGFGGLNRLYKELRACYFDYIVDFHDVLRTMYLRTLFRLEGKKVAHINKGRREKKALIRQQGKTLVQLKSSFQRYAHVLEQLGFPIRLEFTSIYGNQKGDISSLLPLTGEKGKDIWIGIAPFATHKGKIYPLEKMKEVLGILSRKSDLKLFLFGGGKKETDILSNWEKQFPSTICIASKLNWDTELALISQLDVMLSMDSSNMHIASMVGIPVVSIWGATHPYAGFMGWKQNESNAIQVDLPCRPCSIFGNKPCFRNDYACLQSITPKMIVEHIEKVLP